MSRSVTRQWKTGKPSSVYRGLGLGSVPESRFREHLMFDRLLGLARAAVLTLAVAACATTPPPPPVETAQAPNVILISIDGFRADYLQRGATPVLAQLAAEGASGPMKPSFPSVTFPNHYTLVTGLHPDHHGIVGNNMVDAELGRFSLGN